MAQPPAARTPRTHTHSWWQRLSLRQSGVVALASIAPVVILGVVAAGSVGAISTEDMVTVALGAGETPGMLTFAAMFLASPMQWWSGRSQVSVRKFLGIVFYGLAVSNFAMFLVERNLDGEDGLAAAIASSPLLLAGSVALLLATPLFLTSSRWSQRQLGMRRWRILHRLTYVIAASLVLHVLLIPDVGPDTLLLLLGFVARMPSMRRRLVARGENRKRARRNEVNRRRPMLDQPKAMAGV